MSNLGRRGSVNGDEEWQLQLKEAKGSAVPRVKMAAEISLSSHPGCVLVRGAMTLAQRFLLSLGPWKLSSLLRSSAQGSCVLSFHCRVNAGVVWSLETCQGVGFFIFL